MTTGMRALRTRPSHSRPVPMKEQLARIKPIKEPASEQIDGPRKNPTQQRAGSRPRQQKSPQGIGMERRATPPQRRPAAKKILRSGSKRMYNTFEEACDADAILYLPREALSPSALVMESDDKWRVTTANEVNYRRSKDKNDILDDITLAGGEIVRAIETDKNWVAIRAKEKRCCSNFKPYPCRDAICENCGKWADDHKSCSQFEPSLDNIFVCRNCGLFHNPSDPVPEKLTVELSSDAYSVNPGGIYQLVAGKIVNEKPVWKKLGSNHYIYASPHSRWSIGPEGSLGAADAWAYTEQSKQRKSPLGVTTWNRWVKSSWVDALLQLREPDEAVEQSIEKIVVQFPEDEERQRHLDGEYSLVEDLEYNGKPVWKKVESTQDTYLYASPAHGWTIGPKDKLGTYNGYMHTHEAMIKMTPINTSSWHVWTGSDWVRNLPIRVYQYRLIVFQAISTDDSIHFVYPSGKSTGVSCVASDSLAFIQSELRAHVREENVSIDAVLPSGVLLKITLAQDPDGNLLSYLS